MKELEDYTKQEILAVYARIDAMDQTEMARTWRFSESGNELFRSDLPFYKYFQKRFTQLGGMTPEISKRIGLGV